MISITKMCTGRRDTDTGWLDRHRGGLEISANQSMWKGLLSKCTNDWANISHVAPVSLQTSNQVARITKHCSVWIILEMVTLNLCKLYVWWTNNNNRKMWPSQVKVTQEPARTTQKKQLKSCPSHNHSDLLTVYQLTMAQMTMNHVMVQLITQLTQLVLS